MTSLLAAPETAHNSTTDRTASGGATRSRSDIDRVAADLLDEFAGFVSAATVRQEMLTARRDLGREVPREALPEFAHRLVRQRLIDQLITATAEHDSA